MHGAPGDDGTGCRGLEVEVDILPPGIVRIRNLGRRGPSGYRKTSSEVELHLPTEVSSQPRI